MEEERTISVKFIILVAPYWNLNRVVIWENVKNVLNISSSILEFKYNTIC